jgi:hypothetical protein
VVWGLIKGLFLSECKSLRKIYETFWCVMRDLYIHFEIDNESTPARANALRHRFVVRMRCVSAGSERRDDDANEQ